MLYADQVLARAIGWSQHGFCINCGVQTQRSCEAVHAAYGAPVLAALEAAAHARGPPRGDAAHTAHGRGARRGGARATALAPR